jgi:hypothetical protein
MLQTFDPVMFSNQENEFLLKHLGEPSVIALREIKGAMNPKAPPQDKNPIIYPDGVIPSSVKPILDGVYELNELAKHDGVQWVGVEAIKTAIQTWLKEAAKWSRDAKMKRGAPRWPSRYSFDGRGRAHIGGPGSDSETIKTYFGPSGERIPFEIDLMPDGKGEWAAPGFTEQIPEKTLRVDPASHRIECRVETGPGTICGHTETYKPDSRSSYNAARARMSKHLRKATIEVEAHRELHTNEFSS